jgi:ribosomal protein S20
MPVGLTGCLHKKTQLPVFPHGPIALIENPEPKEEAQVEAPVAEELPIPIAEAASVPRRRPAPRPRPTTTPQTPVSPQIAAADPVDDSSAAIGELTAGGDAGSQTRQEAVDLIASNEKRLKALPQQKLRTQRSQISKIQNFDRQAQQALDSGDAEGAKTLATKAQLLLNDLDRGGAN